MSAHFILRYRGQPVRFTFSAGKSVWGIVPAGMASPFISEADAWAAAASHQMDAEQLAIGDRNKEGRKAGTDGEVMI